MKSLINSNVSLRHSRHWYWKISCKILGTNMKEHWENYDEIMNNYNETGKLDIPPIPKKIQCQ